MPFPHVHLLKPAWLADCSAARLSRDNGPIVNGNLKTAHFSRRIAPPSVPSALFFGIPPGNGGLAGVPFQGELMGLSPARHCPTEWHRTAIDAWELTDSGTLPTKSAIFD